jgi:hypothetical protein
MSQSNNSNAVQSIETLLVEARTQIVRYLPRHLDADKMIYVALETVRVDSFLRQCEPLSIVQAVLEASQLGLMLGNKLGHAYLVPRRDKKANNILKCHSLSGTAASLRWPTGPGRCRASFRPSSTKVTSLVEAGHRPAALARAAA